MNNDHSFNNLRWLARACFGVLLYGVMLFLPAARLDWWAAWVYIAVNLAVVLLTAFWRDQELLAERESRRKTNQKGWDKIVFGAYGLLTAVAMPLLAGFNMRNGWQPAVPLWLQILGLVAMVTGWAIHLRAMQVNHFFAKVARIQSDRGQTVCESGPYRWVRHPGYVGGILLALGAPLMLGSWWAFLAGLAGAVAMLVRTALEDKMLQRELPDYIDYTKQVRYRLLPGIW
ncbi:MAG: isoprenylcysteine carboxylmethyltransferase family protein [Anaerolineae bacterium]|nr:isoprenylcysteine carboxylmethyltransferase family protein [Anaerolineae bacterium]